MFRKAQKEMVIPTVPAGVLELVLCLVDEKRRIRYRFRGGNADSAHEGLFRVLDSTSRTIDHPLLTDAFNTRQPVSFSYSHGENLKTFIYMLPFEVKRNRWRAACLQVTTTPPGPDAAEDTPVCPIAESRACVILVDSVHRIRAVGPGVPQAFGHTPKNLVAKPLRDLFPLQDLERIKSSHADTNEAIVRCPFFCIDGSKRDVELKKFSLPDQFTLYCICDISPRPRGEELGEVSARERQRIGQDLHDSIGQTLTGISLLSRSLSNALARDRHIGSEDASQISGLADEASNQIRQISRGLMPSEVVENGLHASLRELARMTTSSCGIACEAQFDEAIRFPDVAVETHLYRIAQEAVNNAVRHAEASRIDIVVSEDEGIQVLEIIDDGQWMRPEDNLVGIGLQTMEYRATAVGGRLSITTNRQGGTRVACELVADESLITRI